jgi:hypothetical protein
MGITTMVIIIVITIMVILTIIMGITIDHIITPHTEVIEDIIDAIGSYFVLSTGIQASPWFCRSLFISSYDILHSPLTPQLSPHELCNLK